MLSVPSIMVMGAMTLAVEVSNTCSCLLLVRVMLLLLLLLLLLHHALWHLLLNLITIPASLLLLLLHKDVLGLRRGGGAVG